MSTLINRSVDMSAFATDFAIPVPAGVEIFSFFGKDLPHSLINFAAGSDFAAVAGTPATVTTTATPPTISSPSGATMGSGAFFYSDSKDNSITVMAVASVGSPGNCVILTDGVSAFTQGFCLFGSASMQFEATFLDTSSVSHTISCLTTLGGTVPNQTLIQSPQFLIGKIDMTNMLIQLKNMTTPSVTMAATAITAGFTRVQAAGGLSVGALSNGSLAGGSSSNFRQHFLAKYNRATTNAEDTAIYNSVKNVLAFRGITI